MWQPGATTRAFLPWLVVLASALAGALCDLKWRLLPNLLTGPVFLAGLTWGAWTGGWRGLAGSLLAAFLMMAPFVVLFVLGGGAGDAKMMAALGAWLGLRHALSALVCVLLAGGVVGLVAAVATGQFRRLAGDFRNRFLALTVFIFSGGAAGGVRASSKTPNVAEIPTVPYGVAIFLGMCAATAWTFLRHAPA